jgi:hypothetical protein
MPSNYKVLGQVNPAANTDVDAYTVPALTQAIISTLTICNQGTAQTTFRVAVRPAGAAIVAKHYVSYDATVEGLDSVFLTLGITLAAGDVVTVRAGTATVSFNVFGSEIT